jgi:hypothetical protein
VLQEDQGFLEGQGRKERKGAPEQVHHHLPHPLNGRHKRDRKGRQVETGKTGPRDDQGYLDFEASTGSTAYLVYQERQDLKGSKVNQVVTVLW